MFLQPWTPSTLDPWSRRPGRALSVNRSPLDSLLDVPMTTAGALPSMLETFNEANRQFDALNASFDQMMNISQDPNSKATYISFEDLGTYETLDVNVDPSRNLVTVTGETKTPTHVAHASRSMMTPFRITKPDRVTAESRDGRVVLTVPADAQAPLPEEQAAQVTTPTNKQLKVNVIGSGERGGEQQSKGVGFKGGSQPTKQQEGGKPSQSA